MLDDSYAHDAVRYALRGIVGTDALAFRAVADSLDLGSVGGPALDLGCGSGRSTRFLRGLGLEVVGFDASCAMLVEGRLGESDQTPRVFGDAATALPFADATFDLVLAAWILLEAKTRSQLQRIVDEAVRVLRPGGRLFAIGNAREFYTHRWSSCDTDFPENRRPLRSGQDVRVRLEPEGVVLTDRYWSEDDYRDAFWRAGGRVLEVRRPLAEPDDPTARDEISVAPWLVFEVVAAASLSRSR